MSKKSLRDKLIANAKRIKSLSSQVKFLDSMVDEGNKDFDRRLVAREHLISRLRSYVEELRVEQKELQKKLNNVHDTNSVMQPLTAENIYLVYISNERFRNPILADCLLADNNSEFPISFDNGEKGRVQYKDKSRFVRLSINGIDDLGPKNNSSYAIVVPLKSVLATSCGENLVHIGPDGAYFHRGFYWPEGSTSIICPKEEEFAMRKKFPQSRVLTYGDKSFVDLRFVVGSIIGGAYRKNDNLGIANENDKEELKKVLNREFSDKIPSQDIEEQFIKDKKVDMLMTIFSVIKPFKIAIEEGEVSTEEGFTLLYETLETIFRRTDYANLKFTELDYLEYYYFLIKKLMGEDDIKPNLCDEYIDKFCDENSDTLTNLSFITVMAMDRYFINLNGVKVEQNKRLIIQKPQH